MVLSEAISPRTCGIRIRQPCFGARSQTFATEIDGAGPIQVTNTTTRRPFAVPPSTGACCSTSFLVAPVRKKWFQQKLVCLSRIRSGKYLAGVGSRRTGTPILDDGAPNVDNLRAKLGGSLLEHEDATRRKDSSCSTEGAVSLPQAEKATKAEPGQVIRLWRDRVTPRAQGIILMNFLTFLYGSNITVVKEAQEFMTPAAFAAGRFAVASLVFLPLGWVAWKDEKVRNAGLELGVWATLGYFTQSVGVLTTDAGRAAFISTFTVIVVPLLAGLFGAKIPRLTWLAAAAAVFGVGMLESGGTPPTVGDLYSFMSAVVFGVHILRTEHHSKSLKRENSTPLIALQLMIMAVVSGIWFACDFMSSGNHVDVFSMSWDGCWNSVRNAPLLLIIYTGLFTTALCLWMEVVCLRDVSATEAAMIYTLEPLWGAAFAWFLLGERWGPSEWLGATFILGGSLMVQLFGTTPENSPAPPPQKSSGRSADSTE